MLPGLKVLCASVLLAVAVVTFALGAAALLRATHENFASLPTWKTPPEAISAFAPQPDAGHEMPTLAMLRIEPSDAERDAASRTAVSSLVTPIEPPADPVVTLAPPPAAKETAPIVVAARPAQIEDTPPVVALPPLPAMSRPPLRTGPLLMPEIATNDAPPVNYATLDPSMFERETEPLEFAPMPRPRPSVVTLQTPVQVAPRRRVLQRQFASVQPSTPAQIQTTPFVIPPIFNFHAP